MRRRRGNPHPLLAALWSGTKAGYHTYRAGTLEERARKHRAKARLNPRTGIPGQVLEVRYARAGKDPGRYVHKFGPNVRMRLGPGRSRVQLYHARGEPIWADERARDYDRWVALDHRRRVNPRKRAMARQRQDDNTMWLLLGGVALWYFYSQRAPQPVSTGGQMILPQSPVAVWYNDPASGGDAAYFQGALPPGASPPWRLASATEIAAMGEGLAVGSYTTAGGGLIAPSTTFMT